MNIYENLIKCVNNCSGEISNLGYSNYGYGIPIIRKSQSSKVLLVGGVHAREHITTDILLALSASCTLPLDFIPMLNPDGVLLAKGGLDELPLSPHERQNLIAINGGSHDFSMWKANGRGVDLNVNFDANWGAGAGNVRSPKPCGYIGTHPESEPEVKAVCNLLRKRQYALVVAYHSKGEEVYWGFGKNLDYREEAQSFAEALGYKLKTTPHSAGGLKDYWVRLTGRLGLTVEVGSDEFAHPYPTSELPRLYSKHFKSLELLTELGERLWTKYKNT